MIYSSSILLPHAVAAVPNLTVGQPGLEPLILALFQQTI
jgi:hypothetical protein